MHHAKQTQVEGEAHSVCDSPCSSASCGRRVFRPTASEEISPPQWADGITEQCLTFACSYRTQAVEVGLTCSTVEEVRQQAAGIPSVAVDQPFDGSRLAEIQVCTACNFAAGDDESQWEQDKPARRSAERRYFEAAFNTVVITKCGQGLASKPKQHPLGTAQPAQDSGHNDAARTQSCKDLLSVVRKACVDFTDPSDVGKLHLDPWRTWV